MGAEPREKETHVGGKHEVQQARPTFWTRPHEGGVLLGLVFAMLAMTPSLIPRSWLFQGLVSGVTAALGYLVAVVVAWCLNRIPAWRRLVDRVTTRVGARRGGQIWGAVEAVLVVLTAVVLVVSHGWQADVTASMGMSAPGWPAWLLAGPLLVVVAALFILIGRVLLRTARRISSFLHRRLRVPRVVAPVVATVVVTLAVVILVNDVLLARAASAVDQAFALANTEDHAGVVRPEIPERSGSPESLVEWDTIGREGRRFVATGPSPAQLEAASDESADGSVLTPIRVYAGLDSAPDAAARAALAVDELERTGAFEREVIVIATTTGSGWVNGDAIEALELMHGGDTAAVATQYSYLPSWLSFLVDRSRAADEAQALADALEEAVAARPEGGRPEVLVYGESLGAYGSAQAYTSLADIRASTDGVLWVGPPNASEVWKALVDRRDPGTPEMRPVYAAGLLVRFASDTGQIATPPTAWEDPRVLYLQHASDPIVWWSPDLLLERPDWAVEDDGTGRGPRMDWWPLVTFWQLTFDLANSKSVPDGNGHNYDALTLDGWVAVAAPDGWDEADTARVREVMRGD